MRVDDPTDALALSESACAKRADTAAELDASAEAANVIAAEPTAELAALLAPPPPQQVRLVRVDDLTLALSESATKSTDTAAELAASAETDTAAEPAAEPAALAAAEPCRPRRRRDRRRRGLLI